MPPANGKRAIVLAMLVAAVLVARDGEETVSASSSLSESHVLLFKFVNDPRTEARIIFSGFSIMPPEGEGWIKGPRQPEPEAGDYGWQNRITFSRILPQNEEHGPHEAWARVSTVQIRPESKALILNDPRALFRYRIRAILDWNNMGRMQLVSSKAKLDSPAGYQCFILELVAEDRGVPNFPRIPFRIFAHQLECVAPKAGFMVALVCSERVPPGEESIGLARECEGFLNSLQFAP